MGTRLVPSLALVAAVVVLAGCGGSSDQAAPETDTAATSPAATTRPSTTDVEQTTTAEPKPKQEPTRITIRIVGGQPQGGIARPTVKKNDKVVLVVRSDTADEIHLHGYDLSREVAAGGQARIAFVAKIPGRFEVELEQSGTQLAELTVR